MSALAASVVLVIVYRALTSENERYATISSRGFRPTIIELKRAKVPCSSLWAFSLRS